jgi:putative Ca2+/H+ antiporter (TMEM165/GDT1 family)
MKFDQVLIGNVLGGLALAFLLDNVAMGGAVTKTLPAELVAVIGFVIFAGAALYGYKQLKKLN